MYSIYDNDMNDYLRSGINSQTKEEAVKAGLNFISGVTDIPNTEIEKLSLRKQEELLIDWNLVIEKHDEEIAVIHNSGVPQWVNRMY